MIVGDQSGFPLLLRDACIASRWKVQIEESPPGESTIHALRRNNLHSRPSDLVIIDSITDGYVCIDTLKIIRAYPSCRSQPIIVLYSSFPSHSIINECYYFDVLKVLEKPKDTRGIMALASLIHARLDEHSSTAAVDFPGFTSQSPEDAIEEHSGNAF
jgi:hypothetical protein